jgi:hypothetical protein
MSLLPNLGLIDSRFVADWLANVQTAHASHEFVETLT